MNIQSGSPGAAFLSNKGSGYPEPKYTSNLQGKIYLFVKIFKCALGI